MSKKRLIHSRLDLKFWTRKLPKLEAVRPSSCEGCGAASRCPGKRLVVVGHGLRERQLRGPPWVGAEAVELTIRVRRFRCLSCGAVMMVAPPEVCRYRLFSSIAIVWALVLFGIERLSAAEVRKRISPWRKVGFTACRGWQTLGKWIRSAKSGSLFPVKSRWAQKPQQVAGSIAWKLTALAPPQMGTESIARQAVSGALHALMVITPWAI